MTKLLCPLAPEMDITGMRFLTLKSVWFLLGKDEPTFWVYVPCEAVTSGC